MALFNEIQVGRINRFVQKLLAIKGGPPVPTVASDLHFVHIIETGAENRYLQGWDMFGLAVGFTALAANNQLMELRNPVGSNVVGVVTLAHIAPTVASDTGNFFFVRGATADQSTVQVPRAFDARGRPFNTCILSTNTGSAIVSAGGVGIAIRSVTLPSATTSRFDFDFLYGGLEVPIFPGDAVYIRNGVVATATTLTLWWRERFLEDSERA